MEDKRYVFYMTIQHCVLEKCVSFNSAGCGRTGSFIAVHYLCEEALKKRKVNVFECVKRMREQRVNMVQTPVRYY